jgi:hypothetical protein
MKKSTGIGIPLSEGRFFVAIAFAALFSAGFEPVGLGV